MKPARSSDFRRVLAAETVSNFGAMLSRLAIPWLATLTLAATPLQMGVLLVADVAAGALAALLLGSAIDRLGKRAVMLAADVLRALLLAALAALAALQVLSLWMLVLAAVASGLLTLAFELARSAWVAQCIAADELPQRNSQLAVATSLSETAAFALGGWLYQGFGAVLALLADAASYLASALCLRGVGEVRPASAPGPSPVLPRTALATLLRDARAGIAAIGTSSTLRALAAIEVLVALGLALAGTSYMIFVAREIGFSTGTLGVIFATGGLGSLLGAWLAPALGRHWGGGMTMALGLALLALGGLCIPLAPSAGWLGAALLITHQIVGDGGHTLHMVQDRTLRQTAVSGELLARVDGGLRTLGHLATLAGALGGGLLAGSLGTRFALVLSAALYALAALLAWLYIARRSAALHCKP